MYILASADFKRLRVVIHINNGGSCISQAANSASLTPKQPLDFLKQICYVKNIIFKAIIYRIENKLLRWNNCLHLFELSDCHKQHFLLTSLLFYKYLIKEYLMQL